MRKKRQANIEHMPPSPPPFRPRPLLADVLKCLSRPIQEDEYVSEVCGAQQIKRRQLAALPDCRTSADRVSLCVCVEAPHKLRLQGQFKCRGEGKRGKGRGGCGDFLVEHIRNKH